MRAALNAEGLQIRDLVSDMMGRYGAKLPDGLDWHNIEPYWIVAELDQRIVGCVQLVAALPMGSIGMFAMVPALTKVTKVKVTQTLLVESLKHLKRLGVQLVSARAAAEDRGFTSAIMRLGAKPFYGTQAFFWDVREERRDG